MGLHGPERVAHLWRARRNDTHASVAKVGLGGGHDHGEFRDLELFGGRRFDDVLLARTVGGEARVFDHGVNDCVVLFHAHTRVDDLVNAHSDGVVRFVRRVVTERTVEAHS